MFSLLAAHSRGTILIFLFLDQQFTEVVHSPVCPQMYPRFHGPFWEKEGNTKPFFFFFRFSNLNSYFKKCSIEFQTGYFLRYIKVQVQKNQTLNCQKNLKNLLNSYKRFFIHRQVHTHNMETKAIILIIQAKTVCFYQKPLIFGGRPELSR